MSAKNAFESADQAELGAFGRDRLQRKQITTRHARGHDGRYNGEDHDGHDRDEGGEQLIAEVCGQQQGLVDGGAVKHKAIGKNRGHAADEPATGHQQHHECTDHDDRSGQLAGAGHLTVFPRFAQFSGRRFFGFVLP